jgi:3-hydroxyacyl-CoA dehydrogenase
MGRGIAVAFAYAGHSVTMIDVKARTAEQFAALEAEAVGEDALTNLRDQRALTRFVNLGEIAVVDRDAARRPNDR